MSENSNKGGLDLLSPLEINPATTLLSKLNGTLLCHSSLSTLQKAIIRLKRQENDNET